MSFTKSENFGFSAIMDETKSPLRNQSLPVAHMLMQMLAWMWSAVFSISLGSYIVFGVTAVAHMAIIAGIFVTMAVFQQAESKHKVKIV